MSEDGSEESWEGDALGLEECLFCPHISTTLNKKVKHMSTSHSFFIPDMEYLTDLEGLITYLGSFSNCQYLLHLFKEKKLCHRDYYYVYSYSEGKLF